MLHPATDPKSKQALGLFEFKMDSKVTNIRLHELDENTVSYIEIDAILYALLEEYYEVRKAKQDELIKDFDLMMRDARKNEEKYNINEIIRIFVTDKEN